MGARWMTENVCHKYKYHICILEFWLYTQIAWPYVVRYYVSVHWTTVCCRIGRMLPLMSHPSKAPFNLQNEGVHYLPYWNVWGLKETMHVEQLA